MPSISTTCILYIATITTNCTMVYLCAADNFGEGYTVHVLTLLCLAYRVPVQHDVLYCDD